MGNATFSKSDRWASPIVFGPGTLWRTWGTRPIPSCFATTQTLKTVAFKNLDFSSMLEIEFAA
jgi:hypothetical protein